MTLADLMPSQRATITSLTGPEDDILFRLMDLGFLEDTEVEVKFQAPWSGDPLAIEVRGSLIALRKTEANRIHVELLS